MPLKAKSTWTDVPWYFCDKESYLSWLTFINVAFPYMQQTFLYPPQTLFVGIILFSRCPSVRPSMRPSVRNALFP